MSGGMKRSGRKRAPAAQPELEELRRKYEDLLNGNLAGIFRTTLEGRFVECNDAMAQALGYADSADLMGRSALELYFDPQDRRAYLEELKARGRLVNYEIRLRHKTGRAVHVLENVYLVPAPEGDAQVLGMFMDITALKRAQETQRAMASSYRDLVERMQDGVMVSVDGVVIYANPAAAGLIGSDPVGSPSASAFHAGDAEAVAALIGKAMEQGTAEAALRMGGGEGRPVRAIAVRTMVKGKEAVHLNIQDTGARDRAFREHMQLRAAQEANAALREEIAQHHRTQEELNRSRRFARSLIASSLDMIIAADREGRITEYNPAASLRFGWEPEEIIGAHTIRLYADASEHERIRGELERHGAYAGEVRNIDRYGSEFISFLAASSVVDEDGQVVGAMGVSRDITRMKQDQEALKASEERYRDLFENASDLIQSVGADGRFEYVNDAWRKALGYDEEDLRTLTVWDVLHPDHLGQCRAYFGRVMAGEEAGMIRTVFRAKDGRHVTVEGTSNLRQQEGRAAATRSIFRDISHELAARRQAMEQEAKLRALFESSEHMLWSMGKGLRLTSFNKGYAAMLHRLYGIWPEVSHDLSAPNAPFASEEENRFWGEKYAIAFGGQPLSFETDLRDREGRLISNEVFLSPVFGPDGQVAEVLGIGHEITERKLAEGKVREQSARLKAIFESAGGMMIWTLDPRLRLTSFNGHFERSIEEAHGIRIRMGDDLRERMLARLKPGTAKELLARHAAVLKGRPQQFEVELQDMEGRAAWVECFLSPIVVDGRVAEISCLAYGITERKRQQQALEQSLAEKEVLLKEVHHRVKNNLQVISSIARLQSEREGADPRMQEVLRHSRDRVQSMAMIHERLYQSKRFSSIDLADYIDGLARNLLISYSTWGRVALDLDLQPVRVGIDQAMPCGLILNEIISNALHHAFSDGRQGRIRIALRPEGSRVRIAVEDDGPGLPEGFDEERHGGLGLELIRLLTAQIDGALQRSNGPGVSYLLTFEQPKPGADGADERTGR